MRRYHGVRVALRRPRGTLPNGHAFDIGRVRCNIPGAASVAILRPPVQYRYIPVWNTGLLDGGTTVITPPLSAAPVSLKLLSKQLNHADAGGCDIARRPIVAAAKRAYVVSRHQRTKCASARANSAARVRCKSNAAAAAAAAGSIPHWHTNSSASRIIVHFAHVGGDEAWRPIGATV